MADRKVSNKIQNRNGDRGRVGRKSTGRILINASSSFRWLDYGKDHKTDISAGRK